MTPDFFMPACEALVLSVYVLAATNRVDLIDHALLRPGRFDYVVKCGLPNKESRKTILNVCCREMCLEEDADLEAVAMKTDGWTGADLKGLITNAQLIAYRRTQGAVDGAYMDFDENATFSVSQADLLSALEESQPQRRSSSGSKRTTRAPAGMLATLA
ncbi:unnamed protein product [Gongylonema pulchrum]|uniref:AAA_lid_3 domain-containing protein n=1 Tax=Gongylonema pulchrum TaxID=637853 RepID=A0A183E035_9BILA|nr:unnamed protein product [Gongylonema pulchrum]